MLSRKHTDLTNQRFDKLIVISFCRYDKTYNYSRSYWNCLCDCGNNVEVRRDHLTRGKTRSCGCINKEPKGHRTPEGQTSFIKLYCNYKNSAKKRNLIFDFTKDQFAEIINKNCHYCDSSPSGFYVMRGANGGIIYNGIDRMDSSKGYTLDNCVPCCGMCNRAKLDLNYNDFMVWINRLANKVIKEEGSFYAIREPA